MGNENNAVEAKDLKVDTTSQAKTQEVDSSLVAKTAIAPGVSRPTSIVPAKAQFEPARPTAGLLEHWHIEGVHLVFFFLILFCLFVGMWKNGKNSNH
jgi:hypothetical protein